MADIADFDRRVTALKNLDDGNRFRICEMCKIPYKIGEGVIYCEQCGEEHNVTLNEEVPLYVQNYSTGKSAFIPFKIVGKGSRRYQLSLLQTCANSDLYRINTERRLLFNRMYQYTGNSISKNVLEEAMELYLAIKATKVVFRGDVKKGVIASCLIKACQANKIIRTRDEIANMMKIDLQFIVQGDRKIQDLYDIGLIDISVKSCPELAWVEKIFKVLQIANLEYQEFVVQHMIKVQKMHLYPNSDCPLRLHCAGSIGVLLNCIKSSSYTLQQVAKAANVTLDLCTQYVELCKTHHRYFEKLYAKYAIK